jgi:excisionase family DNA binding protein
MVIDTGLNNLLTIKEVSDLLHVHPNTLRRWSDIGRIKSIRISSRGDRRYKLVDISNFLAENETPT